MNRYPMSQRLLVRSFGQIGNALKADDDGSIFCVLKPFCSPLVHLYTRWQRRLNLLTCKPELGGHIGGSIGTNASRVMLAPLPLHPLRSLSMVSQPGLLHHLALMC